MNLNRIPFLLFMLLTGVALHAQNFEGTDFRFAFINNLDSAYNGPPVYYITGEAVDGDTEINITFGNPSDPDYINDQILVSAGDTYSLTYTTNFLCQRDYGVVQAKSFHIEATAPITVYATYYRLYYSEGSAIIPTSELSGEYVVVSMNYTGSSLDVPEPSLATIVGLEDNTEVHFIPSDSLVPFGLPAVEQTVILNAGDTYTLASMYDLTTTKIFTTDNVPIAVYAGHKHTYVGCGADNYLYEQLLPMEKWGDHYALIPTGGHGQDLLRIVASEDNTDIFIGCALLTTLNTGEFYEAILDEPGLYSSTAPILPVLFTQGIACNGFETGDPSMRIPIPLHRGNNSLKLRTSFDYVGIIGFVEEFYFVQLVTTAPDSSSVLIDGVPVTHWTPFNGSPNLVYATPEVTPSPSVVEISSSSPFWGEYVALGDFDAIAMTLGSDTIMSFAPLQPFFFTLGPDFGLCPGETALLETNIGIEGTWQDGTISTTYLAEEPGTYTFYTPNPCGTSSDTLVIYPYDPPIIQLDPSYEICNGDSVLLNPNLTNNDMVVWSTGSDDAQIYASNPDWYSIIATNPAGCVVTDSTLVVSVPSPDLVILGPEYFCNGGVAILEAITDAEFIDWSTGDSSMYVTVDNGGNYYAVATNEFGCEAEANFYLEEKYLPYIIAPDSTFCEGSELLYVAESNSEIVKWPGFSDSDTLLVTEARVYEVIAENECGETSKYVTFESEDCSCTIDVPNIFSPNGDGKNDLFLTLFECPKNQSFQLTITDRWGLEVFKTSDAEVGWNGGLRNDFSKQVSTGVYFVLIYYDTESLIGELTQKSETSTVTVIR